ncbi:hypothetical protein ACET3Z_014208 [Daucus carota]
MGPSEGLTRKEEQENDITEEVEKNAGPNFQASLPSGSDSFNWWDHFSKRLTDLRMHHISFKRGSTIRAKLHNL